MEVLIRWVCRCTSAKEPCVYCDGRGYCERWVQAEELPHLTDKHFIIRGRRFRQAVV